MYITWSFRAKRKDVTEGQFCRTPQNFWGVCRRKTSRDGSQYEVRHGGSFASSAAVPDASMVTTFTILGLYCPGGLSLSDSHVR